MMFLDSPSLDEIVERSRELIIQSICARLVEVAAPSAPSAQIPPS